MAELAREQVGEDLLTNELENYDSNNDKEIKDEEDEDTFYHI